VEGARAVEISVSLKLQGVRADRVRVHRRESEQGIILDNTHLLSRARIINADQTKNAKRKILLSVWNERDKVLLYTRE
jgi:hypothetical protein